MWTCRVKTTFKLRSGSLHIAYFKVLLYTNSRLLTKWYVIVWGYSNSSPKGIYIFVRQAWAREQQTSSRANHNETLGAESINLRVSSLTPINTMQCAISMLLIYRHSQIFWLQVCGYLVMILIGAQVCATLLHLKLYKINTEYSWIPLCLVCFVYQCLQFVEYSRQKNLNILEYICKHMRVRYSQLFLTSD